MSRLNKTDSSPLITVHTLGFQKHALLQAANGQRPLPLARLCRCCCNQVHGNGVRRRAKIAIAVVAWRNVPPPASMLSAVVRQRGGAAPGPPINLPATPAVLCVTLQQSCDLRANRVTEYAAQQRKKLVKGMEEMHGRHFGSGGGSRLAPPNKQGAASDFKTLLAG
jgi:hypothetical protein